VKRSLFGHQMGLTFIITVVLAVIIGGTYSYLAKYQRYSFRKAAATSIASILENESREEKIKLFSVLDKAHKAIPFFRFKTWLIDQDGKILASINNYPFDYDWRQVKRPTAKMVFKDYDLHTKILSVKGILSFGDGDYLVLGDFYDILGPAIILRTIIIAGILLILASTLISGGIGFWLFRKKASEAGEVLDELRRGNLKVRFRIGKTDELTQIMQKFNLMADEIEKLVNDIEGMELKRKKLLNELAHDTKTPLTSLRSLSDSLEKHSDKLDDDKKRRIYKLLSGEVIYLNKILDELFLLSQISRPDYRLETKDVNLSKLIYKEVEVLKSANSEVNFVIDGKDKSLNLSGDEVWLQRLVKNVLSNAARYCHKKVVIKLDTVGNQLEFIVEDDGNGFSEEALMFFGTKRLQLGSRESTGLGNMIIKEIIEAYSGELVVENSVSGGGKLTVTLPVVKA